MKHLCAATLLWCCAAVAFACEVPGHSRLAIIIDDLGYSLSRGTAAAQLPAPLTLSIIPHTPHAARLARIAAEQGKEIMVHMPMESMSAMPPDPVVLTTALVGEAFETTIDTALQAVPGATGVNNHMGSLLTTNRVLMERFMARLQEKAMFFIDSRTTPDSVAADVALAMDVPHTSRAVFLDNERDPQQIELHLLKAINIAMRTGAAVAIGHPYPETLEVLANALPRLPSGVNMVPASALTRCSSPQHLTSIP